MKTQSIFFLALTIIFITFSCSFCALKEPTKSLFDCIYTKDTKSITPLISKKNVHAEFEISCHGTSKLAGEILYCKLIHCAVLNKFTEIIPTLITFGADINQAIYISSYDFYLTPLGLACLCDDADMIGVLLDRGANIEDAGYFRSEVGYSKLTIKYKREQLIPLHLACQVSSIKVVELLIGRGANINIASKILNKRNIFSKPTYVTALDIATGKKDQNLIDLLNKSNPSQISIAREIEDWSWSTCTIF